MKLPMRAKQRRLFRASVGFRRRRSPDRPVGESGQAMLEMTCLQITEVDFRCYQEDIGVHLVILSNLGSEVLLLNMI